jgi:hypothetical protein
MKDIKPYLHAMGLLCSNRVSHNLPGKLGLVISRCVVLVTLGLASPVAMHAWTETHLTLSRGSAPLGVPVTLTARVTNGNPIFPGLVLFCNAAASHCTDINVLGQAQLTPSGLATLTLRLGIGIHEIKAEFHGTREKRASVSTTKSLTVTRKLTTVTTLHVDGNTFTAFVSTHGLVPASGTVDFLDATDGSSLVASAPLGTGVLRSNWFDSSPVETSAYAGGPVTGDFNNDGIPDIALATSTAEIVLLGKGDGTFGEPITLSVAGGNAGIGDFNSDGILDLAVNSGPSTMTILLGRGDGTFTVASEIEIASQNGLNAVRSADFNDDGIPDLVTVTQAGNAVVLLGKGDGTFDTPLIINLASHSQFQHYSQGVTVGDFNGDGFDDFAATDFTDYVYVELSKGDGTFTLSYRFPVSVLPVGIVAGDFNGDGFLDLAVANPAPLSQYVSILLGKGNGKFTAMPNVGTDFHPNDLSIADFNGDGIPDLVTVNPWDNDSSILIGKGDGTFEAKYNPHTGNEPYSIAIADFNGDGTPDIVAGTVSASKDCHTSFCPSVVGVLLTKIATTTMGTATDVTVPGIGTQEIFASFPGDDEHYASRSKTTPVQP